MLSQRAAFHLAESGSWELDAKFESAWCTEGGKHLANSVSQLIERRGSTRIGGYHHGCDELAPFVVWSTDDRHLGNGRK